MNHMPARMQDAPRQAVVVTMDQIEAFLRSLELRERTAGTIQSYGRSLLQFYQALPADKRLDRESLARWRDNLLAEGYTVRTVNAALSAVNSFLAFLDLREYQLSQQIPPTADACRPELSRGEYLRLLSAARALGKERAYLLVKVFAVTGIPVHELPCLTVEAVRDGSGVTVSEGVRRSAPIPAVLRKELLDYIGRLGLISGPVFVTRNGNPLTRIAVTTAIQSLARDARVSPEKCNPRCLRRLYQSTMSGIEAGVRLLVEQTHERLLEQEQLTIGWEDAPDGEAERDRRPRLRP